MKASTLISDYFKKQYRAFLEYTEVSQTTYIFIIAGIVGILGGFGAVGFYHITAFVQRLALGEGESAIASLMKIKWYWKIFPSTTKSDQVIALFSYGLLLPFFMFSFFYNLLQMNKKLFFIHFLIIIFTIFHITFAYGSIRFRMPIAPYIIIFATQGIYYFIDKIKERLS